MHHSTDRIAYTMAFVTPVVEHWLEREIAQWVQHKGLIRRPIALWENVLTTGLHVAPNTEERNKDYTIPGKDGVVVGGVVVGTVVAGGVVAGGVVWGGVVNAGVMVAPAIQVSNDGDAIKQTTKMSQCMRCCCCCYYCCCIGCRQKRTR